MIWKKPGKPESKRQPIEEQRLRGVLERLNRTVDTPALIKVVAGDQQCMLACKALVEPTTAADRRTAGLLQRLSPAAGIDLERLTLRLRPVACALGMAGETTGKPDYYDILGVAKEARENEIRRAFRKKVREVHPDTADREVLDSRAFLDLHAAYRTLTSPAMRRRYDASACEGPWFENAIAGQDDEGPGEKQHRKRRRILAFSVAFTVLLLLVTALVFNAVYEQSVLLDGVVVVPPVPEKRLQVEVASSNSVSNGKEGMAEVRKERKQQGEAGPSKGELQARGIPFKVAESDGNDEQEAGERVHTQSGPTVAKEAPKTNHGDHELSLAQIPGDDGREESPYLKPEVLMPAPDEEVKGSEPLQEPLKPAPAPKQDMPKSEATSQPARVAPRQSAPPAKRPVSLHAKKHRDLPVTKKPVPPAPAVGTAPESGVSRPQTVAPGTPKLMRSSPSLIKKAQEKSKREGEGEKGRIQAFLEVYIKAYEARDLAAFSGYFTRDATQNGKAFAGLLPKYRAYFERSEGISYQIDLQRYTLEAGQQQVTVQGIFHLAWKPRGEAWKKSVGVLTMGLTAEGDSFRVKMLNYHYNRPLKTSVWSGLKWWEQIGH